MVKGSVDSTGPPDHVTASNFLFISHQMPQRHHPALSPSLELDAVPALAQQQAISGILAMCFLITPQLQNPFPASCKECELFLTLWLVKRMIITPNQSAAKTQATAEGAGGGGAATMRNGTQLFQVTDKTGSKRVEMFYQL